MTINEAYWHNLEQYICFLINKLLIPAEEGSKAHLKHSSLDKGNGLLCSSLTGNHLGKWKWETLMHRASSYSSGFTCHVTGTLPKWRVAPEKRSGGENDPTPENHWRALGNNLAHWWITLAAGNETDFKELKKVAEHCRKDHSSQSQK